MNNITALNLLKEITELITNSKKAVYQIVDKEDSTKILEIKEIEPFLTLPAKIAYTLLKNKNILTTLQKENTDLIESLQKEYLASIDFDEEKYKTTKDYQKEIDEKLAKFYQKNEVLENFLKDDFDKKLYPLKITLDKSDNKDVYSIANEPSFNLSYVTDLIFEHILLFE